LSTFYNNRTAFFILALLWLSGACIAAGTGYVFNVSDYGAAGNGITPDTKPIQSAINDAGRAGGRVILSPGIYLSGTLFLKSNVTLEICEGAVLLGSTNINDYPDTVPAFRSYNDIFLSKSLIYGDNLQNISITGRGIIDGQGSSFKVTTRVKPDRYRNRPYVIRLIECSNVLIENVSMRNSAMWMQQYLACEFLTVRGINVFNHANQNNDMIDIDGCRNVIISDCYGDTDDDALTFKSTSGRITENVTVTNCVLSSHVNAIKFGTESIGGFRDITISNIVVKPSSKEDVIYGVSKGTGGIILEIVDGGIMDGVNISNIRIDGVQTPLFMRLGSRGRTIREGMKKPTPGIMKNISISNVIASGADTTGSSIHGIPGSYIENVSLDNISITYSGGGTTADTDKILPLKEEDYPESNMFGRMPAYGLYIRYAKNISLNNIKLDYAGTELRPAFMAEELSGLNITGLKSRIDPGAKSMIVFRNVNDAAVSFTGSYSAAGRFLNIEGTKSENIRLIANDYSDFNEVHNKTGKRVIVTGSDIRGK
jgi:polygalacturonase